MDTDKIVSEIIQGYSRRMICKFPAERVRETCISSHHHAGGKVLPFDVTRGDMERIRITEYSYLLRVREFRRL